MTDIAALLRPIRGCATDEQYRDVWDRVEAALLAASPSPWRDMSDAPVTTEQGKQVATKMVLVWGPQTGVCVGTLHRFWNAAATVGIGHLGGDAVEHWGVTHYQPLPEPPSEGEK